MKKCKECGTEFTPKTKKGEFCSPSCKQKDYRKGIAKLLMIAREGKPVESMEEKKISIPVKRYNFKDMPKGLTYMQQLLWKANAKKEQNKK